MDSRNPDELITEVKEEQQTRGELATEVLQWFLDGNVGQLFPRSSVVSVFSDELNISNSKANIAVSDTVGDIVDPVQQITSSNGRYVGVIEYKTFSEEGAYGYVDFDDVMGKRKRVICAKCVEKATHDSEVTHATENQGTVPDNSSWDVLLNRITSHYVDAHTEAPNTITPGASLLNGTTIGGQIAFHQGNDGEGSGLNADKIRGKSPSEITSVTRRIQV